tara:strand:- start:2000 stop:2167 length:168 start_codon:yes stop_codon:yes gene_type:complete
MYNNLITTGSDRPIIDSMLDHNRQALINTVRGLSESDARQRLVPGVGEQIDEIRR